MVVNLLRSAGIPGCSTSPGIMESLVVGTVTPRSLKLCELQLLSPAGNINQSVSRGKHQTLPGRSLWVLEIKRLTNIVIKKKRTFLSK